MDDFGIKDRALITEMMRNCQVMADYTSDLREKGTEWRRAHIQRTITGAWCQFMVNLDDREALYQKGGYDFWALMFQQAPFDLPQALQFKWSPNAAEEPRLHR